MHRICRLWISCEGCQLSWQQRQVLLSFLSLGYIPFIVCWSVRSLLLMTDWVRFRICLKARSGGIRNISLSVWSSSCIACNCFLIMLLIDSSVGWYVIARGVWSVGVFFMYCSKLLKGMTVTHAKLSSFSLLESLCWVKAVFYIHLRCTYVYKTSNYSKHAIKL